MSDEPYYWAKTHDGHPGCTVWEHSLAAGEVAKILIAALPAGVRALLPEGTVSLIAAHDVGKIAPGFQTKCLLWKGPTGNSSDKELRMWQNLEKNHAVISEYLLQKTKATGRCWAACAGAHHGNRIEYDASLCPYDEDWKKAAMELLERIQALYGPLPKGKQKGVQGESIQSLVTGLMVLSDWIASNEACFPTERNACKDFKSSAKKAVQNIGVLSVSPYKKGLEWRQLFPACPCPRPIQQYMWELPAKPGIYLIEDAMGGGKTEAALALAYHLIESGKARGLYFALPTQTTSNRIFIRLRELLENMGVDIGEQNLQLAHSNSWLMRQELYKGCSCAMENNNAAEAELRHWFSSSRRSLLAEYGVGSIDQALMGEIAVKHRDLRRFALAGKVVILDEIHSYDVYTGTLVSKLVEHLRAAAATVVILSATLTRKRAAELLGLGDDRPGLGQYPLVSSVADGEFSARAFPPARQKAVVVHCVEQEESSLVEEACRRAEQGQHVLWIRNTVKDAQRAYRLLQAERYDGGPEMGLLHARFPFWRREELEEKWIGCLGKDPSCRKGGCVLVATQVVEQSIDIDADFLISDLAPTDMLLQRAGRLWRHERPLSQRGAATAPEMLVAVPTGTFQAMEADDENGFLRALGSSARVYAPYVLLRTLQRWKKLGELQLPGSIRELIEATYDESPDASPLACRLLAQLSKKRENLKSLALNNTSSRGGNLHDIEGVGTRYGEVETTDVLLLKKEPERIGSQRRYEPLNGEAFEILPNLWNFRAAKAISRNLVRIPAWMLSGQKEDDFLKAFAGFSPIFSCFLLDNGMLKVYSTENAPLRWQPDVGVSQEEPLQKKKDEEPEFMY